MAIGKVQELEGINMESLEVASTSIEVLKIAIKFLQEEVGALKLKNKELSTRLSKIEPPDGVHPLLWDSLR